ncbi:MAG: glycerol-3-phosphate 1-O-acyltransferase PlsY [Verrucomicrobiota bacterium]
MEVFSYVITAVAAYLLGSIPTGYLVARAKGIDIRSVGSGNIGATNVFRILGKGAGIFVLLFDALKGFVAVVAVVNFYPELHRAMPTIFGGENFSKDRLRENLGILAGVAAILGHNYTCFLKFKGGKGIATSAGVLIALVPGAFLIVLSIFILVVALSRYISLGSLVAALCLPIAVWLLHGSPTLIFVMVALGALAIYKHKANIKRLLNGTENRFGSKKIVEAPK